MNSNVEWIRPAVAYDLDSTIANTHHRHHTVMGNPHPDWEVYSMLCPNDTPIEATVRMIQMTRMAGLATVIISGRDICAYDLTVKWLTDHHIFFDHLVLRSPGRSGEHNEDIKVEQVLKLREELKFDIRLMVDDWPKVQPAMTKIGVPTLIVQPPVCDCNANIAQAPDITLMETHMSETPTGSRQL